MKPGVSMQATPQIQSKKSAKKKVQDVRELSVKKSLLAQENFSSGLMNRVSSSSSSQGGEFQRISIEKARSSINGQMSDFKRKGLQSF